MLLEKYQYIRKYSEQICLPLKTEDYVVQPVADVSPPKWHLGHTTWFFETFILKPHLLSYKEFDPNYNFVFNSYYETIGKRVVRTDRGNLSRPSVEDVYHYRSHVDDAMARLLSERNNDAIRGLVILGLNHEQQHQELLFTDIKYILGHNPLFPAYNPANKEPEPETVDNIMIDMSEGFYQIGFREPGFCFDNEKEAHKVYLGDYQISSRLVTNNEYLEFINAGGYDNFTYWLSEGWEWIKTQHIKAPLYWYLIDGKWCNYTLSGLKTVDPELPVCHINYYEALAFAEWKGMRLPTEFEWEAASEHFDWGRRWEWTQSAYLPYPHYNKAPGAIGEYNGKFMVNQMVLRGASEVTPMGHSRKTYRNFFHPHQKWQYSGIRLAK